MMNAKTGAAAESEDAKRNMIFGMCAILGS